MLGFLKKLLNLRFNKLGFGFLMLLVCLTLLVFYPGLRDLIIVYLIMFVLVEVYKSGEQSDNIGFSKGLILFGLFAIGSMVVFVSLKGLFIVEDLYNIPNVSVTGWVLYFLLVAHVEEEIFRTILPKIMGNILIPQIIYTVFHCFMISMLIGSSSVSLMIPYLITTFVFAVGMAYLTFAFKTNAPAKGVHWMFDLFKKGILFSFVGV